MNLEYECEAFSEADAVVGVEYPDGAGLQANIVDEGTVFAAEVVQEVVLLNTGDLSVAAGDGGIIDGEVGTGVAAYGGKSCLIELRCCPYGCTL